MKKIIFVSAVIGMGLFSCKKDQIRPDNSLKSHKNTEETTKTLHFTPWRDVEGIGAACADLNQVGLSNAATLCHGTEVLYWINNTTVRNSTESAPMYYSDLDTVTVAQQTYIWNYAVNWANAHNPGSGYTVSRIHNFRSESVIVGMFYYNIVKFDVDFHKCI